jgi:hypothetical protein
MKMMILTIIESFVVWGIVHLHVSKEALYVIIMAMLVITDVSATLIERYKRNPNERK